MVLLAWWLCDTPDFSGDGFVKVVSDETGAVGDTITYTLTLNNNGTGDATNILLTDIIPTETTLVGGTLLVDGVAATGDLVNGVQIPDMAGGDGPVVVTFDVRIDSQPASLLLANQGAITYDFDVNGQTLSGNENSNQVFTVVPTSTGADLDNSTKIGTDRKSVV